MSCLHIIRTSAYNDSNLVSCLSLIKNEDGILLMDDGSYCISYPHLIETAKRQNNSIFMIEQHCIARAINTLEIQNEQSLQLLTIDDLPPLFFKFTQTITYQ